MDNITTGGYFKKAVLLMILSIVIGFFISCSGQNCAKSLDQSSGGSLQTSDKTGKKDDNAGEQDMKVKEASATTKKSNTAKPEISVSKPPSGLVKDLLIPDKTKIELWSINTDWSKGKFNTVRYEVHLLSNESMQVLSDYYGKVLQDVYADGDEEENVFEGTISGHECKVTIKNKERIIKDETGKENKFISEIVMNFPSIEADDETIAIDRILPYGFIDIYNHESCALIGVSYNVNGSDLKVNSGDAPEDLVDYYAGLMSKFESFKQVGDKADFSGKNLLANVQFIGTRSGYSVSVTVLKNRNPETVDKYKSGLTISISKK